MTGIAARLLLIVLAFLAMASPATAQAPSAALQQRAEDLVRLLRGEAEPADLLTGEFVAQVPPAQVNAITAQLRALHGAPAAIERIEPASPTRGSVFVDYERAVVRFEMAIQPAPPHRIAELLIVAPEVKGDSLEALTAELAGLPGQVSFAVARLGDGAPRIVAAHRPDRPLAIGSAFKLIILAELDRQVRAGERRWDEVVPLESRSLPSGLMQAWPRGSPVTLHTLATLMISRSDNTATDALLRIVGRENVERMMATAGIADPARNRPFLSTLEAFALKAADEQAFRAWALADEAGRRRLLAGLPDDPARIDLSRAGVAPARIEQVEWFASAADLVRLMDWLRRNGSDEARAILAVNPGVAQPVAQSLGYVGFKGGSEPGVINLSFLVRDRAGAWHAVAGSWNDPASALDEDRFVALMMRAVQLLR